jgi:hypothetical protein
MVGDIELELFEYALDNDTRLIEGAVERLEYESALAEAEQRDAEVLRFAAALEAGAILPMDF